MDVTETHRGGTRVVVSFPETSELLGRGPRRPSMSSTLVSYPIFSTNLLSFPIILVTTNKDTSRSSSSPLVLCLVLLRSCSIVRGFKTRPLRVTPCVCGKQNRRRGSPRPVRDGLTSRTARTDRERYVVAQTMYLTISISSDGSGWGIDL